MNGGKVTLYIAVQPVTIRADRAMLLGEALAELLRGGLSKSFAFENGHIGLHLWAPLDISDDAILLVADDGQNVEKQPSTPEVAKARRLVERAGCHLDFVPSRGVIWRVYIGKLLK